MVKDTEEVEGTAFAEQAEGFGGIGAPAAGEAFRTPASEMGSAMKEPGEEVAAEMGAAGTAANEGMKEDLNKVTEPDTVSSFKDTVVNTIQATGSVANEGMIAVKDVFKGALSTVDEIGTGLAQSTTSVARGIVVVVSDVGGDVISAAGSTQRCGGGRHGGRCRRANGDRRGAASNQRSRQWR